MVLLFDPNILITYETIKSTDFLPLECDHCHKNFTRQAKRIKHDLKTKVQNLFCSNKCSSTFLAIKHDAWLDVNCANCSKQIRVQKKERHASKSGNSFCSQSCAAIYNNTHKTTGTRRSKLEVWLETQLKELYPNFEIIFNGKEAINSELDIYIPTLSLAFELNGVFHYEPIYGQEKLASIQNNDNRKFQACLERSIELVIIDVSRLSYFKSKNAEPYLKIITDLIDMKFNSAECTTPDLNRDSISGS